MTGDPIARDRTRGDPERVALHPRLAPSPDTRETRDGARTKKKGAGRLRARPQDLQRDERYGWRISTTAKFQRSVPVPVTPIVTGTGASTCGLVFRTTQ